jgi:hypothetical protein
MGDGHNKFDVLFPSCKGSVKLTGLDSAWIKYTLSYLNPDYALEAIFQILG